LIVEERTIFGDRLFTEIQKTIQNAITAKNQEK